MADNHIPREVLDDERLELILLAIDGKGTEASAESISESLSIEPRQFWRSVDQLKDLGLVSARQRASNNDFSILESGEAVVDEIRGSYKRGTLREAAIRRAVLEAFVGEDRVLSDNLAQNWSGPDLDPAPSADEIQRAGEWLKERGLVNLTGSWGGPWIGKGATGKGHTALNSGNRLVDNERGEFVTNNHSTTTFYNQGANIGAQSVGDYNEVNGSVTVDQRVVDIREALDAAAEAAIDLPDDVREAIEDARHAAHQEEPRLGMLRTLLKAVATATGTVVGTAAGQEVLRHIEVAQEAAHAL